MQKFEDNKSDKRTVYSEKYKPRCYELIRSDWLRKTDSVDRKLHLHSPGEV